MESWHVVVELFNNVMPWLFFWYRNLSRIEIGVAYLHLGFLFLSLGFLGLTIFSITVYYRSHSRVYQSISTAGMLRDLWNGFFWAVTGFRSWNSVQLESLNLLSIFSIPFYIILVSFNAYSLLHFLFHDSSFLVSNFCISIHAKELGHQRFLYNSLLWTANKIMIVWEIAVSSL